MADVNGTPRHQNFDRRPQNLLVRTNQCQPIALSLTVVILRNQIRQAADPRYAQLLHFHQPTEEDIDLLNTRVGVPIPPHLDPPVNTTSNMPSTSKEYPKYPKKLESQSSTVLQISSSEKEVFLPTLCLG